MIMIQTDMRSDGLAHSEDALGRIMEVLRVRLMLGCEITAQHVDYHKFVCHAESLLYQKHGILVVTHLDEAAIGHPNDGNNVGSFAECVEERVANQELKLRMSVSCYLDHFRNGIDSQIITEVNPGLRKKVD